MKLIISLLALAVLGGAAFAADEKPAEKPAEKPKRDPEEIFKRLDTNSDGKLTKEEFLAGPAGKRNATKAEENFKKWDKDNNGELSLEEFKNR